MTSNVDPINESLIQDAITELTNRTVCDCSSFKDYSESRPNSCIPKKATC